MKKGIRCACSLILMFSGATFSQGSSNNLSPKRNASAVVIAQLTTEQLIPGEPKAGSLSPANTGTRVLNDIQYTVQYPGGGAKLVLEFRPDYPVNFYVRRNLPVTMEGNRVVYDSGPFISGKSSFPNNPPLDAVTYFIAVENYSPRLVNFTVTANLVGPPTADTVDLALPSLDILDKLELGSIPMPEPGTCVLGRTQYTISVADLLYCGWGSGWFVSLRGDQNLNLYVRNGQRVAVEEGRVVADFVSKPPEGNGLFSVFGAVSQAPTTRTYFIAVENCNSNAANYSLTFRPQIPDLPSPTINGVFLDKKNLLIRGYFLDPSSTVLFDGEPQKTKYGGQVPGNPFVEDLLIVKKARNKLRRGEAVAISVKLSGCVTQPVQFTRP